MSANPSVLQTGFWSGGHALSNTSPEMLASEQPVKFGMLTGTNSCLPCSADPTGNLCSNSSFPNQQACIQAAEQARSNLLAASGPEATLALDVTPATYKYAVNQSLSQPSYAGAVDLLYSSIWR